MKTIKYYSTLLIGLIGFLLLNNALYAGQGTKLRINIKGAHSNIYFLCMNHSGCTSIYAGSKGILFPVEEGEISYLITADATNFKMYKQTLPQSCHITTSSKDKMLTVSGSLAITDSGVVVNHLACKLT